MFRFDSRTRPEGPRVQITLQQSESSREQGSMGKTGDALNRTDDVYAVRGLNCSSLQKTKVELLMIVDD